MNGWLGVVADEGTFKPFLRRINDLPLRPVPLDGHDVEVIRKHAAMGLRLTNCVQALLAP